MAKTINKEQEAAQQEKVIASVSKVDAFLKENQKIIWGCVIAVLVIVLAVLAWHKFVAEPKRAEAAEAMAAAERHFQDGSYEIALEGDGIHPGFTQVREDFGSYAPKSVNFYAGVCELQIGLAAADSTSAEHYREALSWLKAYKGKDAILKARAKGAEGDALAALEDYKGAVQAYEAAAAVVDNSYAAGYLMKAAEVWTELGRTDKALALYKQVKEFYPYPRSIEAMDVDKYISRIENAEKAE